MTKTILLAALVLSALSPARAAEKQSESKFSALKVWFKHLKEGLAESAVTGQYQKHRLTAVAAVRGAKQEAADPGKPGWKGAKDKKARALRKERAEFGKAVDLILEGKTKEGAQALEAFEKAHPKSSLLGDVQEAKAKLKELETASSEQ